MFFRTKPKKTEKPKGMERVRLHRCSTAKRIALRVDPARCQICLVLPKRASEKKAWDFAQDNKKWIVESLSELETPVPFIDGNVFPIFGINRTLRIIKTDQRITKIELKDDVIEVRTSRDDPSANVREFLYKTVRNVVEPMAHEKAAKINKKITAIQLRNTRARWGSCNSAGKLMFCWRLIFAPMHVVEYIVGHEVSHLKHMNHGPKFWELCEQMCETMEPSRQWLIEHGDKLVVYGLNPAAD